MIVSILAVGRPKILAAPILEYEARAARYWRLEVEEIHQARTRDARIAVAEEAKRFNTRLDPRFQAVGLSRQGRSMSSVELAGWLQERMSRSSPGVHFLVGGAFGLDPDLISRCDLTLSLSSLTLPHDMARLLLAEQIYRAGTILRHEPYHKGPA